MSTEEKYKCDAISNPFSCRPWMTHCGAAAPAGGGESAKGLKGIIAGGLTGGIEISITYPTEYVKTQLQLDQKSGKAKQYDGALDVIRKTVRERGFFGIYRGLGILLLGSVPKAAVRFGAFETLKGSFAKDGQLSAGGRLLCGLGAGVCEAIFAVTPMETIKVKFIHDQRSSTPKYRGLFHGISTIVKNEGIGGIYKGVVPTVVRQGSNQAIRFFVMESLKEWYKGNDRKAPVPKYVVGAFGVIAGAASVFGNTPVDVIKTRMQGLEASKYKNTWDCAVQIWKQEGFKAFYSGTVPRLSRVCLDVAITFMVYDSFMELFQKIWP